MQDLFLQNPQQMRCFITGKKHIYFLLKSIIKPVLFSLLLVQRSWTSTSTENRSAATWGSHNEHLPWGAADNTLEEVRLVGSGLMFSNPRPCFYWSHVMPDSKKTQKTKDWLNCASCCITVQQNFNSFFAFFPQSRETTLLPLPPLVQPGATSCEGHGHQGEVFLKDTSHWWLN